MRPVPAAGNRLARAIRFARVLPLLAAAFGSGSRPLISRPGRDQRRRRANAENPPWNGPNSANPALPSTRSRATATKPS